MRKLVVILVLLISPQIVVAQQAPTLRIRFRIEDSAGSHVITGRLQSVTSDSLIVRLEPSDAVMSFGRREIVRLERQRSGRRSDDSVVLGCVAGAAALGLYGHRTSHSPDSPGGYEIVGMLLGGALGCGVGAGLGYLVSRGPRWESFSLEP